MNKVLFQLQRFSTVVLVILSFVAFSQTEVSAQSLYKGAWIAESFGNDKAITGGASESSYFQFYAMPFGYNCNPYQPRCAINSTVVNGTGMFDPIGTLCTPIAGGNAARPANGATLMTPNGVPIPPLFRNPANFTSFGAPRTTSCNGYQTVNGANATTYLGPGNPLRGPVQRGAPISGLGYATINTVNPKSFMIPAAAGVEVNTAMGGFQSFTDARTKWDRQGMARKTTGSFPLTPPYLYSYTYADMRNATGTFGEGQGFFRAGGALSAVTYMNTDAGTTVASVMVAKGSNASGNGFGGVMQLLGQFTTKVCYFYAGGCGLGTNDWYYESIGQTGMINLAGTAITAPNVVTNTFKYFNSGLLTTTTYYAVRQRFPWTTGMVTVTATGRGPHKTFHQRVGFDNRNTAGVGTVQLVSPILTQWLGTVSLETGGIAVMQIEITDQLVPEPGMLAGMVAGLALLGVAYRRRL